MMRKRGVGVLVWTSAEGAPEGAECEECDWFYQPALWPESLLAVVNEHLSVAHPEQSPYRQERYVTFVLRDYQALAGMADAQHRWAEGRQAF